MPLFSQFDHMTHWCRTSVTQIRCAFAHHTSVFAEQHFCVQPQPEEVTLQQETLNERALDASDLLCRVSRVFNQTSRQSRTGHEHHQRMCAPFPVRVNNLLFIDRVVRRRTAQVMSTS